MDANNYIKRIHDWKSFLLIVIILLLFWFLMSPSSDLTNILIGVGCCLGITYFWSPDLFKPGHPMRFSPKQLGLLALYLGHLVYNIVVANIHVAMIILNPKMPISPGFILVKTKLEKDFSRTLYANSITLTPGTITINLNKDRLLVHALTEESAKDVSAWYLEDRMREMEVKEND